MLPDLVTNGCKASTTKPSAAGVCESLILRGQFSAPSYMTSRHVTVCWLLRDKISVQKDRFWIKRAGIKSCRQIANGRAQYLTGADPKTCRHVF